jgi:hypothetical protein
MSLDRGKAGREVKRCSGEDCIDAQPVGLPDVQLERSMGSASTPLSGHHQQEPVACPRLRIGIARQTGLCLSCLLSQGLPEENFDAGWQNREGRMKLEDVLQ